MLSISIAETPAQPALRAVGTALVPGDLAPRPSPGGPRRKTSSQRELLTSHLAGAVARQDGPGRSLAFDPELAERIEAAGGEVVLVAPDQDPPRRARFDLIAAVGLVERVRRDRATLRSLKELLAPGGLVLIAVPLARQGCPPPEGCRRSYVTEELVSAILRSGLCVSRFLAEGPELVVAEARGQGAPGVGVLSRVDAATSAGRWSEAESLLASMSEQMEDEAIVRELALLVGHVHLARGRLIAALEAFQHACGLGEPAAQPLTGLGAVALAAGDLEAARELFGGALERCPTSFAVLRGRGLVQRELNDLEGALISLDMAATQRPAERELAEQVVELALAVGWSGSARQAIDRYVRWTGDEPWATRLIDELTSGTSGPGPRSGAR